MRRALGVLVTLLTILCGCGGVPAPSGFGEPIIVSPAELHEGAMPGGPTATGTETVAKLAVDNLWFAGRRGVSLINSLASEGSYAVALELVGVSHGYWVFPVGEDSTDVVGFRTFNASLDVASDLPPGNYTLRAVALDANGNGGPATDVPVCVYDPLDTNSCSPTDVPPDTVISLNWDLDVDLDLIVIAPDGTQINSRHPVYPKATGGVIATGSAVFDADSNANCVIDGRDAEHVTWADPTSNPGQYQMYVDLNSTCGQPSVHYTLSVYRRQNGTPQTLVRTYEVSGTLLPINASGGVGIGTYVGAVTLP